ncbi:MAG TPA: putative glycoside hydrolase, partial [Labilithrix sp.]
MVKTTLPWFALALLLSCTSKSESEPQSVEPKEAASAIPQTPVTAPAPAPSAPSLASYLEAHLPAGGSVEGEKIFHTIAPNDTHASIAAAYLNLTEIYLAADLARELQKKSASLASGQKIEIPSVITRVPRDPKEEKLGWPEDKALRGIFVTGFNAQQKWQDYLDKVVAHGMNAIVLDGKDYDGWVTFPTKAKIALEDGAAKNAPIPDLARIIRFAHWKGVRIIFRIPCFHDPLADKRAKDQRLSLRAAHYDAPSHTEWIDPTNTEAQDYAIELANEGIEAGADEIQLDYVRFPVNINDRVVKMPEPKDRPAVIRDFVKRVKAVTKPAGVMLSLDLFGVAATGIRSDIDRLGQDIGVMGIEADAISPMVYPSHYDKGYRGWANPADHPEIVGIGTKAAVEQVKAASGTTVVRSWIQAFAWLTTVYTPKYVVDQTVQAEQNGGGGWLLWNPNGDYNYIWSGFDK